MKVRSSNRAGEMDATADFGSRERRTSRTWDLPFSASSPLSTSAFGLMILVPNPRAAIPATSASRSTLARLSSSSLKQPSNSFLSNDALFRSSPISTGQCPGNV